MKLFLSLLVMVLAVVGLILVLKPAPKKKKVRRKLPGKPSATLPSKTKAPPAALPGAAAKEEPSMEEIRQAVRKYVTKFPGLTAQVLQGWVNPSKEQEKKKE